MFASIFSCVLTQALASSSSRKGAYWLHGEVQGCLYSSPYAGLVCIRLVGAVLPAHFQLELPDERLICSQPSSPVVGSQGHANI